MAMTYEEFMAKKEGRPVREESFTEFSNRIEKEYEEFKNKRSTTRKKNSSAILMQQHLETHLRNQMMHEQFNETHLRNQMMHEQQHMQFMLFQ